MKTAVAFGVLATSIRAGAAFAPSPHPQHHEYSHVCNSFGKAISYPASSSRASSFLLNMAYGPEIEVVSQADKDFLDSKGVFSWGTWGCEASKFPWSYDSSESCYLLQGKVTVIPTDGRKPATFGKGDFVTFPAGMSCTWDVSEAVQKHFKFF